MKIVVSVVGIYIFLMGLMYIAQEKLIFFPENLPEDYSFSFSASFEEVLIPVEDGQLHALAFEHPQALATILYFHGNAGSLASWGYVYEHFQSLPYNIFIIDYRGYGKSDGQISSEAQLQQDALAAYLSAKKRYPQSTFVFYGRSIGTGIASWLATQHPPSMLILESPYFNLPTLVGDIYPFVPKFLVKYTLMNNVHISKLDIPIHLLHGTNDELIPFQHSERLKNSCDKAQLHIIDGGGHNDLSLFAKYHKTIQKLLAPPKSTTP
ncbi:MAG: alpha/beta hydrolase [Proteobacteria bacterium]|nr:alpha/beta hydrolase [Pseudomonadota bacterium]